MAFIEILSITSFESEDVKHPPTVYCVITIDLNNTGSRIHMPQVKPAEMTNLEYQDGGQSAFSIDK